MAYKAPKRKYKMKMVKLHGGVFHFFLKWYMSIAGFDAMVLWWGDWCRCYYREMDEALYEHEYIHAVQWNRHKWKFPFKYFWESLRHGYKRNKYELEAERARERYWAKQDEKK